jgi:hypothetical protein
MRIVDKIACCVWLSVIRISLVDTSLAYIGKYTANGQKVPRNLPTYAHFHTTLKITQKMYVQEQDLDASFAALFLYFGNHRRISTRIRRSAAREGFLQ